MTTREEAALKSRIYANLVNSITYISRYCHNLQSCNKCMIKKWCKEKRKNCPEEWFNN